MFEVFEAARQKQFQETFCNMLPGPPPPTCMFKRKWKMRIANIVRRLLARALQRVVQGSETFERLSLKQHVCGDAMHPTQKNALPCSDAKKTLVQQQQRWCCWRLLAGRCMTLKNRPKLTVASTKEVHKICQTKDPLSSF